MTPSGSAFSYFLGNPLCQCWIIWWELLTSISPHEITIASFEREMPHRLGFISESLPSCPRLNYRLFCPNASLVNKVKFGELGWVHEFNSLSRNQRGTHEKKYIALEYYGVDMFPSTGILHFLVLPFTVLQRCYVFHKLKARPSTKKKGYYWTLFIAILALIRWSVTEHAGSPSYGCTNILY